MTNLSKPITLAAALAILWAVLAVARPAVTYHLAPLLVAGVVPFLSETRPHAHLGAVVGGAIAGAATLGLGLAGHLTGPSLLPAGGAVVEAWVFGAMGAVLGWAWALGAAGRVRS